MYNILCTCKLHVIKKKCTQKTEYSRKNVVSTGTIRQKETVNRWYTDCKLNSFWLVFPAHLYFFRKRNSSAAKTEWLSDEWCESEVGTWSNCRGSSISSLNYHYPLNTRKKSLRWVARTAIHIFSRYSCIIRTVHWMA